MPEILQVDAAIVEAMAFLLTTAPVVERSGTLTDDRVVSYKRVLAVALEILVRRFGFDPRQSAKVLTRRLAARDEHYNQHWTPHHPSCEPGYWKDMSTTKTDDPYVTPSGRVRGVETR